MAAEFWNGLALPGRQDIYQGIGDLPRAIHIAQGFHHIGNLRIDR